MSLLKKLERVVGAAPTADPPPAAAPPPPLPSPLREALEGLRRAVGPASEPASPLGWSLAPAPFEEAFSALRAHPVEGGLALSLPTRMGADHRHGLLPLGAACSADYSWLSMLMADPALASFDPRRAVYLDIETTGLEHGAGNVAFMIALGWFEGDSLRVEQLLLKEPDGEVPQLAQFWDWLNAHPYLVTFNGKSFDLSILQGRLVMHRFASPDQCRLKLRPHLDLLHISRAFYKGLWPDTRLQTLERECLGFTRVDDLPGALAPRAYFHWLREGDAAPLREVARHNLDDVLTMVVMAAHLAALANPEAAERRPAEVSLNLAGRALRQRQPELAARLLAPLHPGTASTPTERDLAAAELGLVASRRAGDDLGAARWAEVILTVSPDHAAALRARRRATRTGR